MAFRVRVDAEKKRAQAKRGEAGFSMVQIVVTMAVIAIVTSFALVRIASARDHMRLVNSAREFASITEKARLDSIRRHTEGGASSVVLNTTTTYQVFMDFDYNGTPETRTFTLPSGVQFTNVQVTQADGTVINNASLPVSISFDWRGRSTTADRITFQNSRQHTSIVGITNAGEVSLDRNSLNLLAGTYSAIVGDTTILGGGGGNSNSNLNGNTNSNGNTNANQSANSNSNGNTSTNSNTSANSNTSTNSNTSANSNANSNQSANSNTNASSNTNSNSSANSNSSSNSNTNSNTNSGAPRVCSMSLSSTSLSLRNSGSNTPTSGTVTVSFANAPSGVTFTAQEINNGSRVTVSISGNTITISSKPGNGNRGNFTVRVTPTNCGAAQDISVSVAS